MAGIHGFQIPLSLPHHQDHLRPGQLVVAELDPLSYREHGRVQILEPTGDAVKITILGTVIPTKAEGRSCNDFRDVDHLNSKGAAEFTKIFEEEMLNN